ncbi:acyltransferase family protein [Duganella levis]|uniref:Acyltransferase family protein n=1 Tax=Duganella levis TaxID=2692169 RepID=A0ABW9W4Y5_9BURK|nr:acyltransferase family protein [Duganella levis]MYN29096.1 acyltransferase family protein [Duganella levis]
MNFRQDINGLRAIAVLAVIAFHFNPAWLPGGFAGVDVFFVISGYLMTSIIYRGLADNNFSVPQFYLARGRRIIPALLAPCALLLVVGWFVFLPSDYDALGKHVAASVGFVSNMVYWKESGYFAAGAHEKWLLHTWSLSVEWQFYLLYPLCLLLLKRVFGLKPLRWILLAGTVLGYVLACYASSRSPDAAFFLLPTRAWEMMAGGLALLFPLTLTPPRARVLEAVGVTMIIATYALISESALWPGYLGLLPVAGATLLICANRQTSAITSNKLMQWFGNISYSLYLWHWPVVVMLAYSGMLSELRYQLLGIATSVVCAQLSYSFIEQRVRKKTQKNWSRAWFGGAATLCGLGLAIMASHGAITPVRAVSISDRAQFVAEYALKKDNLRTTHWIDKCNVTDALTHRGNMNLDPRCVTKSGDGGVFLWGDSHAEALSYGLRQALPAGTPFYQVTASGCRPSILNDTALKGPYGAACEHANRLAIDSIAALHPAVVVLAQQKEHEKKDWEALAIKLKSIGVSQIVLVGPVPQWQPSLPAVVANRHWNESSLSIVDAALDQQIIRTNSLMKQSPARAVVTYISLIDALCKGNACEARVQPSGDLLLVDYGHLSAAGSLYVVKNFVVPQLRIPSMPAKLAHGQ